MPRKVKGVPASELIEKVPSFMYTEPMKGERGNSMTWLNGSAAGESVVHSIGTQAARAFVMEDPKLVSEPGETDMKWMLEVGYTNTDDNRLVDGIYETGVAAAHKQAWFGKKKSSDGDIRERLKHPFYSGTAGQEDGCIGSTRFKLVSESTRANAQIASIFVVTTDEDGVEAWRRGDITDVHGGQKCVCDARWMGVNVSKHNPHSPVPSDPILQITPLLGSYMGRIVHILVWELPESSDLPCGVQLPPAKRPRVADARPRSHPDDEEGPTVVLRDEGAP